MLQFTHFGLDKLQIITYLIIMKLEVSISEMAWVLLDLCMRDRLPMHESVDVIF